MNGLRFTLAAGIAATLACTSLPARADAERGLSAGVRLGYAVPFGDAQSGQSLQGLQRGMLPVWFDLGYRFSRHVYLGVFYQYAPTFPYKTCSNPLGQPVGGGQSCDGNDQRFGIDLHYHILPKEMIDPWVGLGVGYEISRKNFGATAAADSESYVLNGFQFVDLQLGADLRFVDRIPFGPFIDLSFGEYSNASRVDTNGNSTGVGIGTAVHEWLTFGVRAQFNL